MEAGQRRNPKSNTWVCRDQHQDERDICMLVANDRKESTSATHHSFWELNSLRISQYEEKPEDQTLERYQNKAKSRYRCEAVLLLKDSKYEILEYEQLTASVRTVKMTEERVW